MSGVSFPTDFFLPSIADADYDFVRRTVYEHSRIELGAEKKALVASRLAKRLRALEIPDYEAYCNFLRSPSGKDELGNLVEVISTNHTHFFREERHFDFLREIAIPQWRANRQDQIRIWSAACSSGEEPYTIAIVLAEALGLDLDWRIFATDISTSVLEVARAGIYARERLSHVPDESQRRFFQRGKGANEGEFRVKEQLRARVDFRQLNLLQAAYPFVAKFDVIFCRNVMIYFDRPTQEVLVHKLTDYLKPDGYLMIGHSESLSGMRHSFNARQPAVYQK